jgi:hypothetical protein
VALGRKARPTVVELVEAPVRTPSPADLHALVASAAEVKIGESFVAKPLKVEEWQRLAYYHLDICGELRFVANRHANALSRCRIFVAEVDEYGRPGKECEEADVQALSETVFGGHTGKAEAVRLMGLQLYVGGESYIVAEGRAAEEDDTWYVVTAQQLRAEAGTYQVKRPQSVGGGMRTLTKGQDLLMRVWTPHPADADLADAPTRSVLPILREIERLSMLTMSQIDSRLISAGLLLLPAGTDFPHAQDKPGGIVGLMEMILEAAKAQLTGAGTAAGLVPILAEIPLGSGKEVQHLTFSTPIQAEIKEKLDHAIRRLALGLDVAPEELLGQGDSNHWSAWAVDETSIKLFISPVLARMGDALTQGYLTGALEALGKDPDKYVFWFDTSPLAARPDKREDAFKLFEKGLISIKALLEACNFSEDDAPEDEELTRWRLWQLLQTNAQLVYDPQVQKLLNLPAIQQQAPPQPAQPALEGGDGEAQPTGDDTRALPQQDKKANANEDTGDSPEEDFAAALLPVADLLVTFALEKAGGRIVGQNRSMRGRYGDLAKFDLHTVAPAQTYDEAETLLNGGLALLDRVQLPARVDRRQFGNLLEGYCRELIVRGHPHQPKLLADVLRKWRGRVGADA